jgi:hypothetical protein
MIFCQIIRAGRLVAIRFRKCLVVLSIIGSNRVSKLKRFSNCIVVLVFTGKVCARRIVGNFLVTCFNICGSWTLSLLVTSNRMSLSTEWMGNSFRSGLLSGRSGLFSCLDLSGDFSRDLDLSGVCSLEICLLLQFSGLLYLHFIAFSIPYWFGSSEICVDMLIICGPLDRFFGMCCPHQSTCFSCGVSSWGTSSSFWRTVLRRVRIMSGGRICVFGLVVCGGHGHILNLRNRFGLSASDSTTDGDISRLILSCFKLLMTSIKLFRCFSVFCMCDTFTQL